MVRFGAHRRWSPPGILLIAALLAASCGGGSGSGAQGGTATGNGSAPSWCGTKKISLALADGFGDNNWRRITRAEAQAEANLCPSVSSFQYADGQGNTQKALDYMARALKQDSEVPEVHLGFVKVYLALGEMDKARHHLERALKLDATNPEAREFARMLAK